MGPLLRNVRIGVAVGLAGATALSAWALGLALLTGSATLGAGPERLDVLTIVAAYYGAGVACGAVGGVLLPLGRWRVGAAVAGMLGAAVLYGAVEAVKHGGRPWTGEDFAVLGILAVVVGAPVGLIYRDIFAGGGRKRRRAGARRRGPSPPAA